jgi:hypothetical protein
MVWSAYYADHCILHLLLLIYRQVTLIIQALNDCREVKMETLTYDEVVELLERAVAERGEDYVYPKEDMCPEFALNSVCQYFVGSRPSCIIGQVLAYKGITAEQVTEFEGRGGPAVVQRFFDIDDSTQVLIYEVQSRQDDGLPWGEALANARAFVGNVL